MKTRTLISILIVVLAVMVLLMISCATRKKASLTNKNIYRELRGTWINTEYDVPLQSEPIAKIVVRRESIYEMFYDTSGTRPNYYGEIIFIEDKWIDSEGNIWFKLRSEYHGVPTQYYELNKLHSSGNVWELQWSSTDYPNEINPNSVTYRIRYRQE